MDDIIAYRVCPPTAPGRYLRGASMATAEAVMVKQLGSNLWWLRASPRAWWPVEDDGQWFGPAPEVTDAE